MSDQWGWYSAPAAIQVFSRFFCSGVSFLRDAGGGICSFGLVEKMRWTSSLSSALPGSNAPTLIAAARWSSRSDALRAALSGPWQAKQLSARMGRISRLYSSLVWAGAGAAQTATAAIEASQAPRTEWV